MRSKECLTPLVKQRNDIGKTLGHRVGRRLGARGGNLGEGSQRIPGSRPRRSAIGGLPNGDGGRSGECVRYAGRAVASACGGNSRRVGGCRDRADQFGRSRQIGDVGEADQHHFGGLDRRGCDLHLFEALQQHLPSPGEDRHRQLFRERPRPRAIAFGDRIANAGLWREL